VKFRTEIDERLVKEEARKVGVSVEELFVKKRDIELGLTDFERSRRQRENWWRNRWKYMKGIRRFHRSTAGKAFHRSLGRFLATREFEGSLSSYQKLRDKESETERVRESVVSDRFGRIRMDKVNEYLEFLIGATSAVTHALVEKRYFPVRVDEEVEYNQFLLYLLDRYMDSVEKILEGREQEVDWEFWKKLVLYDGEKEEEKDGERTEVVNS